jgi:hypothetical protein
MPVPLAVAAWVFAAASSVAAVVLGTSVHRIREGHVGVYYRGGALLPRLTEAGYRLKSPITRVEEVQITMQKVPQQPQRHALRAISATARGPAAAPYGPLRLERPAPRSGPGGTCKARGQGRAWQLFRLGTCSAYSAHTHTHTCAHIWVSSGIYRVVTF